MIQIQILLIKIIKYSFEDEKDNILTYKLFYIKINENNWCKFDNNNLIIIIEKINKNGMLLIWQIGKEKDKEVLEELNLYV